MPRTGVFPAIGLGFLCLVVVAGSIVVGSHLLRASHPTDSNLVSCAGKRGENHVVSINNSKVSPWQTRANTCDTLTITNDDNELRLMAFGTHQHHQPYNGVAEQVLGQGQGLEVVLNTTGTYQFHDHIHPSVVGEFIVTKP